MHVEEMINPGIIGDSFSVLLLTFSLAMNHSTPCGLWLVVNDSLVFEIALAEAGAASELVRVSVLATIKFPCEHGHA